MPSIRAWVRRCAAIAIVVLVTLAGLTAPAVAASPSAGAATVILPAADLSLFRAGNIISDAAFFDSAAMSEGEIQAFLEQKVPSCRSGYTCLKDWHDTSRTTTTDPMCNAYAGGPSERASTIIYKVSQACGISPRVLLVMLEKEQGLVTHTWPSAWRYTIAMGQGCPDTAGCDERYHGFFNQVYGAAWQFKRYANPPGTSQTFTWYAPGKTWNIRYNPNTNCGSAPVYIENQATANLYYYTPYQPNRASLNAGYGTGDSCSSYGNRNFYNFYTDWFGAATTPERTIVRAESGSEIYLASAGSRWHITDWADYTELNAAFGPTHVVSSNYIAGLNAAGTTSAVLRDSSTGTIALVQGGQTHRFASCEAVAQWGASCATPTNVAPSLFSRIAVGSEVGAYFRVRDSATWGRFDGGGAVTPLYNESAARAVNGDVTAAPYAPFLSAGRYAELQKNRTLFAPAQLIKSTTDSKVYLTLDFDRLAWVTDWSAVIEYHRTPRDLAVVPATDLEGYREDGTVAPTLTCAGITHYPASGWLYRLTDPARVGLTAMTAGAATCAQFSQHAVAVTGDLAVKVADTADVWVIENATRRAVLSWSTLMQRNAGAPPVGTVARSTLEAMPEAAPIADGAVVKSESSSELHFVSGTEKSWIPSAGIAADLGIALSYSTLSPAQESAMTQGPDLGLWVMCQDHPYFGASGRLWPISAAAASGFAAVPLTSAACAALPTYAVAELGVLAVKATDSPDVFVAEAGVYRRAVSWEALVRAGGGVAPRILAISPESMAGLTVGLPIE